VARDGFGTFVTAGIGGESERRERGEDQELNTLRGMGRRVR